MIRLLMLSAVIGSGTAYELAVAGWGVRHQRTTPGCHWQNDMSQQRQGIAMGAEPQGQQTAGPMIDQAENGMDVSPHILLARQIQALAKRAKL